MDGIVDLTLKIADLENELASYKIAYGESNNKEYETSMWRSIKDLKYVRGRLFKLAYGEEL